METRTRRERKKEETRQRILEASFKLFIDKGFETTTVDQITENADIGKGTFYNYFSTKETALYEIMENVGKERGQLLWAEVLKLQDTRQRLVKTFKTLASWFEEYPELIRVYMMDRINLKIKDPANYNYTHLERYVAEVLRLGQEKGDIRDDVPLMQITDYLMGIFLMQICRWFETGAGQDLYRLLVQSVDFFLIGALSTE